MNTRQFQINELTLILTEHFQWSKPRMACFVGMLVAIVIAGTVNLTQLALFFPSRALISSRYRRIQRLSWTNPNQPSIPFAQQHWQCYSKDAWRWLGWNAPSPDGKSITRYPMDYFLDEG